MRKRKNVFITVLAVIMAVFAMSVSVCAAQKNPLSQMPKRPALYSDQRRQEWDVIFSHRSIQQR